MTNEVTTPDNDDIASRTLQRLKKSDKEHERQKLRLKRMALFEDVQYVPYKGAGLRTKKKATRQGHDSPQVQLMIERRNRYERCVAHVAKLQGQLEAATDLKEIDALNRSMALFEKLADNHLAAIEKVMDSLTREASSKDANRTKILTSAAQLSQLDRHHQDKMAVAKAQNPSDLSEAELLRIASEDADTTAATDANA